jgi:Tfp pilus assembly protein PilX
MNASIIRNEKGIVLMIVLMVLVVMSLMGLAAVLSSNTDVQISANSTRSTQALYLAEAGVGQVQNWFYNPASFNPPSGSYTLDANNSMGTYSFPSQFFSARRIDGGLANYYNASGMSQFTDISNSGTITATSANNGNDDGKTTDQNSLRTGDHPVLSIKAPPETGGTTAADTYLNSSSTGLFKDLSKMGRVTILEIYPPMYSTNYATVRVKAVDSAGAARTIEAEIGPVASALFNNAVSAKSTITLSGSACTDSYDSAAGSYGGTAASCTGANNNGAIQTDSTANGAITMSGSSTIHGNATVGVGGNVNTAMNLWGPGAVTGTKTTETTATTYQTISAPTGLSCSTSLNFNNTVTIGSAGTNTTVCYSSISISGGGVLQLLGNVTLVVTGNIAASGSSVIDGSAGIVTVYAGGSIAVSGNGIITNSNLPTNMSILETGTGTVDLSGSSAMYASVYAPNSNVTVSGTGGFFGGVTGNNVTASGSGGFHYDEALSRQGQVVTGYYTAAWREVRGP